jgi:hypothetical protein
VTKLRVACAVITLASGCDYLWNPRHVDPAADGQRDDALRPDDSGVDVPGQSFCAMQQQKKMCADFDSLPYGLQANFSPMNTGTGGQPTVATGGFSAPGLLGFAIGANSATSGADYSVVRTSYTETGFNGLFRFMVKTTTPGCQTRVATLSWPPSDYGVIVETRSNGFMFFLTGTGCPLGSMMTTATLDLTAWHRVELYVNVPAGTAVVVIDGEMHTFSCPAGFAGTPGLMRTELGAYMTGPHAACDVQVDDVLIR